MDSRIYNLALLVQRFACVLILCSGTTFAQQPPVQDSLIQNANQFIADSKWPDAEKAFAKITAADPSNGSAWMGLAEASLQLKKYDDANTGFNKAIALNFRPWINQANLARVAAARGDHAKAMEILNKIGDSGFGARLRPYINSSTEFAIVRNTKAYQDLLTNKMAPCKTEPYRQFDFWVGDWSVQNPNGNVVGHNLVTLEQEGCLLVEHWTTSAGGSSGTSFNYFDVRDKKWHQLYIDNTGNAGNFPALTGALQEGKMVMLTDATQKPLSRWTWYVVSPGKVRQMAEQSQDDGKTWMTTWDSYYVKK